MKQLEGYISDPSLVFKLKKSLYGLKQALREWYSKTDAFLLSQNLQRCKSDLNVYIHNYNGHLIIIVLYVDDLLITGSTFTSISVIKTALHNVDVFVTSESIHLYILCIVPRCLFQEVSVI